ncbi:Fic family protein [Paenibacillus sp. DS2015]|uniref:Fic family protein n=1 Tax=Paenibacillus sp. DS2015 TaxID=3373917 RepID=UPI003D2073D9
MTDSIEEQIEPYVRDKYISKQNFIYRQKVATGALKLWEEISDRRKKESIQVNLKDQKGNKLWFVMTPELETLVEKIEYRISNDIQGIISRTTNWDEKVQELLIDEAFHSSVIEGAISTRKRTAEMLKKKQAPQDHSERMIYNNYEAMMFILDHIDEPLTEEVFVQLHKIITNGTLEEDDITDKYRDDDVQVKDMSIDRVIYQAPIATEVQWMMDDLFEFIHSDTPDIHPIIKASIIQFYIVYVHPFFDGNGRTARAFTVMYLLGKGFNFFKYLSISTAINKRKNQYYKAIEDCEKNPTDVTYFLINQLQLMHERSIELLQDLQVEVGRLLIDQWLDKKGIVFAKRQMKEIWFFSKKEKSLVTIEEYQKRHKVSYETARTDLMELDALGIFDKIKVSRKYVFKFNFREFCERIAKEFVEGSDQIKVL